MDFENAKHNFDRGFWNSQMLSVAVKKGVITPEQFLEITTVPYEGELEAIEYALAAVEAATILTARVQRQLVQTDAFSGAEYTLFAKAGLFPEWAAGESYVKGNRVVHENIVYEVQQHVTAQGHQPPGSTGMLAIYRPISIDATTGDEPDGSRENPHQWLSGMDVYNGKYYTHENVLYLAKADMIPCVWAPGLPGLWQWELVG